MRAELVAMHREMHGEEASVLNEEWAGETRASPRGRDSNRRGGKEQTGDSRPDVGDVGTALRRNASRGVENPDLVRVWSERIVIRVGTKPPSEARDAHGLVTLERAGA